jgi:hypothetical protein
MPVQELELQIQDLAVGYFDQSGASVVPLTIASHPSTTVVHLPEMQANSTSLQAAIEKHSVSRSVSYSDSPYSSAEEERAASPCSPASIQAS